MYIFLNLLTTNHNCLVIEIITLETARGYNSKNP